jgi:hypothetical protein
MDCANDGDYCVLAMLQEMDTCTDCDRHNGGDIWSMAKSGDNK